MDINVEGDSVSLQLTRAEAGRLGIAIAAGYENVSRAEYYIRTGLAQQALRQIADVLTATACTAVTAVSIDLKAGEEEIENPRRPRPSSA